MTEKEKSHPPLGVIWFRVTGSRDCAPGKREAATFFGDPREPAPGAYDVAKVTHLGQPLSFPASMLAAYVDLRQTTRLRSVCLVFDDPIAPGRLRLECLRRNPEGYQIVERVPFPDDPSILPVLRHAVSLDWKVDGLHYFRIVTDQGQAPVDYAAEFVLS